MKVPMGPPPPRNSNPVPEPSNGAPDADGPPDRTDAAGEASATPAVVEPEKEAAEDTNGADPSITSASAQQRPNPAIPYSIPPWSMSPELPFFLEVLKDGAIIEQLDVCQKGAYMFGRVDLCDFVLDHPSISRFHAVLQFKQNEVFLYDIGSTHGTFINKTQVKKKAYVEVHVGDVIRFGLSSRLYIFQGPTELMPPEGNLEKVRKAKIHQEMLDREASLSRARAEATLADGISWGMDEDALEEDAEDDTDEVTWKTYKGQLTERQEKTRGKIIKRMEKVANMKKEIDAIRVKDISQGGLTQGQQTQIARNEQRMSQIMEELESLEETLNDSIRESLGARSGKLARSRKKADFDEEDDMLSDDDDFYDRTKKKARTARECVEQQTVETSDTLLDKKEAILSQMEERKALLRKEQEKKELKTNKSSDAGDDLDTYMADLSSQLVHDRIVQIQDELSGLQTELDKVMYLLKIADPMGEATRKREFKTQTPSYPVPDISKPTSSGQKQDTQLKINATVEKKESTKHVQAEQHTAETKAFIEDNKATPPVYSSVKPQWLGATREMEREENMVHETHLVENEVDDFVDYKDRNKALSMKNDTEEIEHAAPGLIIRKPKPTKSTDDQASNFEVSTSSDADTSAADAVALLLKHARGYSSLDEMDENNLSDMGNESGKGISKAKRVVGPSRPTFLEKTSTDYESWVPPEGQTGDGRTTLNDRLGY